MIGVRSSAASATAASGGVMSDTTPSTSIVVLDSGTTSWVGIISDATSGITSGSGTRLDT